MYDPSHMLVVNDLLTYDCATNSQKSRISRKFIFCDIQLDAGFCWFLISTLKSEGSFHK